MADPLEPIIRAFIENWYWFFIVVFGGLALYYYLQQKDDSKKWAVSFKKIFRKNIIEEEKLNKARLKVIKKGLKTIGKIKTYSEIDEPCRITYEDDDGKTKTEDGYLTFCTVVFTHTGGSLVDMVGSLIGMENKLSVMRFLKTESYPKITTSEIIFSEIQTFKEKDGFYVPIIDRGNTGYERLMNNITEDIQKFDKDRTLDITASSMMKLSSLPPEWAHQEKMKEMDMEIFEKYRKGIGWKAG